MNNTKGIKILLIDDERSIAETIIAYAKKDNFIVTYCEDGEKGIEEFQRSKFDLLIIDWMLPGISGPEIIKKVREKSEVPILMISARDDESDVVIGLDIGADDYITKPFGPREMIARIKSLLRRNSSISNNGDFVKLGNLKFSFEKNEIYKKGEQVNLTPNEFRLFKELYKNKGIVVSREKLMEDALGYRDFLNDRTLDTHMKNLRKKLEEDPKKPQFIKTVREMGFKLSL